MLDSVVLTFRKALLLGSGLTMPKSIAQAPNENISRHPTHSAPQPSEQWRPRLAAFAVAPGLGKQVTFINCSATNADIGMVVSDIGTLSGDFKTTNCTTAVVIVEGATVENYNLDVTAKI